MKRKRGQSAAVDRLRNIDTILKDVAIPIPGQVSTVIEQHHPVGTVDSPRLVLVSTEDIVSNVGIIQPPRLSSDLNEDQSIEFMSLPVDYEGFLFVNYTIYLLTLQV